MPKFDLDAIRGGTEKPGIPDAVFAMPPGMTIRYDQPADDIRDFITGYHVYGLRNVAPAGQVDWFLPATANVRVAFAADPIEVRIGRRVFNPLPQASLFGPTSHALRATTHGGLMIGFGISALGWARLTRDSAGAVHNRIVPLGQAWGGGFADRLVELLSQTDGEHLVKPLLDELLRPMLRVPHRDEPAIRALIALLAIDGPVDIATISDRMNLSGHTLRRISVRYFGLSPKLLLMRARFLRSFMRMIAQGQGYDGLLIDPSYCDVSHFLRDANRFLGMTPRRFLAMNTPFLRASVQARAAVLGTPTQALHAFDWAHGLAGGN